MARLILIGDDEALDVLADLSRHLDYFEVSRLDDVPDRALDSEDHLVVGAVDGGRGLHLMGAALAHGTPGFAAMVPEGRTPGARAILVAAQLIQASSGGSSQGT